MRGASVDGLDPEDVAGWSKVQLLLNSLGGHSEGRVAASPAAPAPVCSSDATLGLPLPGGTSGGEGERVGSSLQGSDGGSGSGDHRREGDGLPTSMPPQQGLDEAASAARGAATELGGVVELSEEELLRWRRVSEGGQV